MYYTILSYIRFVVLYHLILHTVDVLYFPISYIRRVHYTILYYIRLLYIIPSYLTYGCCILYHPIVLLLLIGVSCARPGESENALSVQRPQPHTTNPSKEENDKTVGDKKERTDRANRKALALLLKPASPIPSNTGSLRSFQRDTDRGKNFCDTEKSYNEEARTSAYEQPKHHE